MTRSETAANVWSIDPSDVEASKRRISEYFDPKPPPQEDCLGSGFIGLMDYFLYEGADVRNLLHDFAIVLADLLACRNPKVAVEFDGTDVILSDRRNVYLNVTRRIDEEWHKQDPNANMLATRIEADLLRQISDRYPTSQ